MAANAKEIFHDADVFSRQVKLVKANGTVKYFNATLEVEQDPVFGDRDGTITWMDKLKVMCGRNDENGITEIELDDKLVVPNEFYPASSEQGRTFQFFGEIADQSCALRR